MSRCGTQFVSDTDAVVRGINDLAHELAAELLPNGHRAGQLWKFSGIADTGRSESAWVHLSGGKIGKWFDLGSAAPGEDKGDMLDLIRLKLCHGDARAAFEEARRRLGMPSSGELARLSPAEKAARAEAAAAQAKERAQAREQAEAAEKRKKAGRAQALWLGARPIVAAEGSPAERYLLRRGLSFLPSIQQLGGDGLDRAWPGSLRFHPEVYHGALERKFPALVASIVTPLGEHIGTHRIFLQRRRDNSWGKLAGAPGVAAKMVLGNCWGGFIPINKGRSGKPMTRMPEGEPFYACEGLEDALAIRMVKPEARIGASVSLANLGAIVLPPQAGPLVIVADRDEKPAAKDALERAIALQQARGRQVQLVMPPKAVNGETVKDINDWLRALGTREAA